MDESGSLESRVAVIETELRHVATKADVAEMKSDLVDRISSQEVRLLNKIWVSRGGMTVIFISSLLKLLGILMELA